MSDPGLPIATPPGTTLSTPSPTELHDHDPFTANQDPEPNSFMMSGGCNISSLRSIYLLVATTPCRSPSTSTATPTTVLGIGRNGRLPWPMVKADMTYFRKATQNLKWHDFCVAGSSEVSKVKDTMNSVIMGRKTYESIPEKFRPLAGRTNIIVTRSNSSSLAAKIQGEMQAKNGAGVPEVSELPDGSQSLNSHDEGLPPVIVTTSVSSAVQAHEDEAGQIFCIGGAEIYNLFLQDQNLRPRLRLLQTEILKLQEGETFECDTFWPEDPADPAHGWEEASKEDVTGWTGVELPQGRKDWIEDEMAGVRVRTRGWQQKSA